MIQNREVTVEELNGLKIEEQLDVGSYKMERSHYDTDIFKEEVTVYFKNRFNVINSIGEKVESDLPAKDVVFFINDPVGYAVELEL